jgi:competence protein ComEC
VRGFRLREGPAPALGAAACLAAGIFFGAWSVGGAPAAAAAAAVAGGAAVLSRNERGRVFFGAVLFLAAGFLLGYERLALPSRKASRTLAQIDRSIPVEVRGRMTEYWSGRPPLRRSRLRAQSVSQGGIPFEFPAPIDVRLSGELEPSADRGDDVTLVGEIRRQGVSASRRDLPAPEETFSLAVKSAVELRDPRPTLLSRLSLPNRRLARLLESSSLPEMTVKEPIEALLLGRIEALDRGLSQNYRRGGLAHLLVVSGLHVALLAGGLELLLGLVLRRPRLRDALVLAAVLAFSLFAGGRAPVMRAGITLAVLLVARILEKPVTVLQAAGLSALAILAARPADLFTAGFFLTYAAAAGIAVLTGPLLRALTRVPKAIRTSLAVTLAAQAATAPIVFWRYNLVAGISWLAAPLCLPLLAALLSDGALILLLLSLGLPAGLPGAIFSAVERLLEAIAEKSAAAACLRPTPPLAACVAMLALLALAALRTGRLRFAGAAGYAALFLVLAFLRPAGPPQEAFTVEALDVGQGDSILLRSGSSAFLVDGGGSWDAGDEDYGRTRLLPKLLDRGVTRLDGVALTHPHPDHALGLFSVVRELSVGTFYRGSGPDLSDFFRRLDALAAERGTLSRALESGDRFAWGGGEFRVLRSGGRLFKTDPINNESVVMIFQKGRRRVLLTGDAGMPAEREILDGSPAPGAVDILKVGHHGSRTSSSAEFLRAFSPRAALLSCGRENRFHHPSPQTVESFARARIPLFRTDLCSDVGFFVTPRHLHLFERGLP